MKLFKVTYGSVLIAAKDLAEAVKTFAMITKSTPYIKFNSVVWEVNNKTEIPHPWQLNDRPEVLALGSDGTVYGHQSSLLPVEVYLPGDTRLADVDKEIKLLNDERREINIRLAALEEERLELL